MSLDHPYRPLTISADDEANYGSASDDTARAFGGLERKTELERQLVRKIDRRLAFLVLVSIMNYLDRYNAAAARLRGLEEDLHMTGSQFSTLISVLYVGYVLMQVPSNIFISQIQKPSSYIACCVLMWGLCSITIGFSQSYSGVLTSRFVLGFCEAAFAPGMMFLLTRWYKPDELSLRIAILMSGSSLSNALGVLIASGIMEFMDGSLGLPGWRWLFLTEGFLTVLVAIFGFFVLPDYPSGPTSWLTYEEHALACARLRQADRDSDEVSSRVPLILEVLTDWKLWWLGITMSCIYACTSFTHYMPTLSATLGYGPTKSLLLCAPPWMIGTVLSFCLTRHSDSSGERFWHVVALLAVTITGCVVAMSTTSTVVRYLSIFLVMGCWFCTATVMAWVSDSFQESSTKRAIALALVNTLGMCGAIGGPYFWPPDWGPSYVKSFFLCGVMALTAIPMLWLYRTHLQGLNKIAEEEERVKGMNRGFRYAL